MPEIEISTLEKFNLHQIADCFSQSFSDYVIPMHIDVAALTSMIKGRSVDLAISPACIEAGKLVGFILVGVKEECGEWLSYNSGTGVIPSHRGQGLTSRMYEQLIPKLLEREIHSNVLEVIEQNEKARHVYRKLGYSEKRILNSYRGQIDVRLTQPEFRVTPVDELKLADESSFYDWQPSWQNSSTAINKLSDEILNIAAWSGNEIAGFAIYHKATKRIMQLAVDRRFRRKRVASSILSHIAENHSPEVMFINIDAKSIETNSFIEQIGLKLFVRQIEMAIEI
ncbi:MAG: GNAT family N-acetyltransferase [Bacteroidia bacterium]